MRGIFTPDPNRSAEARMMFELGYIKRTVVEIREHQTRTQVSAEKPTFLSDFLADIKERLEFLAAVGRFSLAVLKVLRMVPWGVLAPFGAIAWAYLFG